MKLKILNDIYEIFYGENAENKNIYGEINYGLQIININDRLTDKQKINTLLHELFHLYLYKTGLYELLSKNIREALCQVFSFAVIDIIYNNQEFLAKIRNVMSKDIK